MNYPVTPEDFREYMADHGLVIAQVADLLNTGVRIVSYWRSGERKMSYAAWFTLRAKVEGRVPEEAAA